jgi:SAM-dependent methyltransferase
VVAFSKARTWLQRRLAGDADVGVSGEVARSFAFDDAQRQSLITHFENVVVNQVEAMQQSLITHFENVVVNQVEAMRQSLVNSLLELHQSMVSSELQRRLLLHETLRAGMSPREIEVVRVTPPFAGHILERSFAQLEARYPRLFPVWRTLLVTGEEAYRLNPAASVSVYDNPGSVKFRAFCLPSLKGTVLDIGCGPVPVPIYLDGYDLSAVAGIDPFGSADGHPFAFARAIAEDIPWQDAVFDNAVVATSLDHLLDLELGLREIARVIKPNGHLLAWVFFVPGAKRYDPATSDGESLDKFHLFHLDKPWFLELITEHFSILEEINIDNFSYFYRLLRKPG